MLKILGFIFCLIIQATFALFINLRILQFYKKNIDVKQAFRSKDLSVAQALKFQQDYNDIISKG